MPDRSTDAPRALHQLVQRLLVQVDSAHSEIGQTRNILDDAIVRLIPAFTANRSTERRESANAHATRAAGTAFSALQFQDMSDQLLAHAQSRLVALQLEMNKLASILAVDDKEFTLEKLIQRCEDAHDSLSEFDISLQKPVAETHLGTGEIEFF